MIYQATSVFITLGSQWIYISEVIFRVLGSSSLLISRGYKHAAVNGLSAICAANMALYSAAAVTCRLHTLDLVALERFCRYSIARIFGTARKIIGHCPQEQ
jgi:hypothetical protein